MRRILELLILFPKCLCWRELAQLVPDHVLGDEYLQVIFSVVDHERMADELRHDCAGPSPRGDRVFRAHVVLFVDFSEQFRIDKRPFF